MQTEAVKLEVLQSGEAFARAVWQVYTVLTLASKTSISTVAVSKQL